MRKAAEILIKKSSWILIILTLLLISGVYWQCIDTQVVGFIQDDGVYTITGKALATGQGFKLLHVLTTPGQVKYPIVYPLILGLGWLINPHFPANLPLLSLLTTSFTIGAFGLIFLYLRSCKELPRWLAWVITILIGGNYFLMYYGTALMSEGPYLFFSILTLYFIEKNFQPTTTLAKYKLFLAVLLSALVFHTRILGLSLILAITLWLWRTYSKKLSFQYLFGTLACTVLPWFLWGIVNRPKTYNPIFAPLLRSYSNYAWEFSTNYREGAYLQGLIDSLASFIHRLLEHFFPIIPNYFNVFPNPGFNQNPTLHFCFELFVVLCTYGLAGYFLLQLIETCRKTLQQKSFEPWSLSGLYLSLYCISILIWNSENQMARFLTAMLPLLWFYFFKPLYPAIQIKGWKAWPQLIVFILSIVISSMPFFISYQYIHNIRENHRIDVAGHPELWREYQQTFEFIKQNLAPSTPIATEWDTVFYLYTGHPTVRLDFSTLSMRNGDYQEESFPQIWKTIAHYKVRYLILEPQMTAHTVIADQNYVATHLLFLYPKAFTLRYQSPLKMIKIYEIHP